MQGGKRLAEQVQKGGHSTETEKVQRAKKQARMISESYGDGENVEIG